MGSDQPLAGQTAIVTGASAGIGEATARALARNGANLVLAARRADKLESLAEVLEADHGIDAAAVPTDVTDEAAVDALVTTTVERFGSLDLVVANAGTGTAPGVAVEDLPTEQYRTVMGVNVDGMFFTARAAIPHLRDANGTLVFVASFAGNYPRPASPVYAATKWWTRGFALSLAGQVGSDDVGVTLIHPSEVRTDFGKEYRDEDERMAARFEPGEVTEPADVAEAVAFAARQEPPNAVTELALYRRDKFAGW